MAEDADSAAPTNAANAAMQELLQHVERKLLPSLAASPSSPDGGLDFLQAKNSLLVSYLIDLVLMLRNDDNSGPEQHHRLVEMKTILTKLPNMDKKLRYQIDKLLTVAAAASTYVVAAQQQHPNAVEDPLQFRPDPSALLDEDEENDGDSESGDSEGSESDDQQDVNSEDEDEDDDDDDLAAAKLAVAAAGKNKKSSKCKEGDTKDHSSAEVYRAPRLTAVPYTHDKEAQQAAKDKRQRKRLRASELAQTLKAQYGEAPDQEDAMTDLYGKQRAAVRKLAQLEKERTEYEEANFIRLQRSRKEKKEKKRIQRMMESGGDLAQMANLGNLVRETQAFGRNDDHEEDEDMARDQALQDFHRSGGQLGSGKSSRTSSSRHANGKRRRERDNTSPHKKKRGIPKAQNSLQAALYGSGSSKRKSKGKR